MGRVALNTELSFGLMRKLNPSVVIECTDCVQNDRILARSIPRSAKSIPSPDCHGKGVLRLD